jgi:type I restriction enzyme S subunit
MMPILPVPDGWTWAPLGEIAEVVGGVTKDTKKQSDPALPLVPYLRVANVQRGYIDVSSMAEIRVPESTVTRLQLQPGDVLLNEGGDRDKLGRGWVWEGQIPNCIHQNHVFRARIRNKILHPKLLAWFANECAKGWFEKYGKQTTNLASISLSMIKQLPVPVPPVDEQGRLLDLLEDHLSRLDATVHGFRQAARRANSFEQAALARCRGGLERPLDSVTLIQGGIQKQRKRLPTKNIFPFLRVANVSREGLDLRDVHEVELFSGELDKYRLTKGDLLVVEGNGSPSQIGRAAAWDGSIPDCVHQNHLIRVRPLPDILPEYLEAVWNSPQNRRQLTSLASSSSGLHTLSVSKLKTLRLPVPTKEEQATLVAVVDDVRRCKRLLDGEIEKSRIRAGLLRHSLMEMAFSGRLTGKAVDMEIVEELAGV